MAAATKNAGFPIHWNWTNAVWNSDVTGIHKWIQKGLKCDSLWKAQCELLSDAWETLEEELKAGNYSDLIMLPLVLTFLEGSLIVALIERVLCAVVAIFPLVAE